MAKQGNERERFFKRFRCGAATHGECDCPKCQGYCKCPEGEEAPGFEDDGRSQEAANDRWASRHYRD